MNLHALINNRNIIAISLGTMILAAILMLHSSAHAGWFDKDDLSKSDSQGAVTVAATLIKPDKKTDEIRFTVKLDTHSVNLDQYKLEDLSFLRINGKDRASLGLKKEGSGHHITNVLRFPGPVPEGKGRMELVIKNLADAPERILVWELPLTK